VRLWLSAVVTASNDAIVSFSLDRAILSWNGGAERMFGYTAEEAIGQPLELLQGPDAKDQDLFVGRLVASRPVENYETVRRHKDGSAVQVSVTVSAIRDESGETIAGTAIVRDISSTKRTEEALRDSREQLQMILENAREFAIFSTDLDRRITVWNNGALALLGYTEGEVLGQPADVIFTDEDRAAGVPEKEAQRSLEHGRASDDRFHQRKDGSRFWASGAMMLMRDADGQARGFVKILRDQSQVRKSQEALQQSQDELTRALADQRAARDALEADAAAKDRFLAVLSHELRNPLASIAASAQVLDVDSASVNGEATEVIRRQAAAISALLDDMLDISRLRLGRLSIQRRPTSLVGIIEGALQSTRPIIEASGHTLEVRLPTLDVEVDADPNRLVQVVSNLLANAAKYTPKGGVIALEAAHRDGEAVVEVRDNGIGLNPGEIEELFDMFTQGQGQDAIDRSGGGLGIGLALSRSILQMHGGWIRAESAGPGKGSRFSFGLPALRQVPLDNSQSAPPSAVAARVSDALILLADDNQDAAWAVTQWLALQGFRTLKAEDGASALALAETHRPQVMLMDIGMPQLSGHEVARRIRAHPWGKKMLLVAITGWGHEQDVRASMEAGFDLHMTKPVDMPRLRDVIESYLSNGDHAEGGSGQSQGGA
jgi:two-component system CheB/CheR fusion protein